MVDKGSIYDVSAEARPEAMSVLQKLEDAGYEDIDPWWSWKDPDDWTIDFVITAVGPGVQARELNTSSIGVEEGEVTILTLRFPHLSDDVFEEDEAWLIGDRIQRQLDMEEWTNMRISPQLGTEWHDIHIEEILSADIPPPVVVARKAARAGDIFEQLAFEVGGQ